MSPLRDCHEPLVYGIENESAHRLAGIIPPQIDQSGIHSYQLSSNRVIVSLRQFFNF